MPIIKIEVELDSRGAVVSTRQLSDEVKRLPQVTQQAVKASKELTFEQMQASRAAEMLASRMGMSLPEGARRWMVTLKGVAPALSAAFSASAVIAIGMALFTAGKGLYDWIKKSNEAKQSNEALNKILEEQRQKLSDLAAAYDLIGSKGLERQAIVSRQLEDARVRAEDEVKFLENRIAELKKSAAEVSQKVRTGGFIEAEFTEAAKAAQAELRAADKEGLNMAQQLVAAKAKLAVATQSAINVNKEFAAQWNDELKQTQAEALKAEEAAIKKREEFIAITMGLIAKNGELAADYIKTIAALRGEAQAAFEKSSGFVSSVAPPTFQEQAAAGLAENQRAALATIKIYQDQKAAVDQLAKANADLGLSIAKRGASHEQILAMELAALDKQKALYQDNADAIAEIERRKGLLIQQTNMDIADDAKAQFDRSAQAIENFFDRVFLSAKSFSDVWKQLWTQSVSWVVKQFSHMVAGWLAARNQMGQASTGGGAGGILAGVSSLIPGLQAQTYGTAATGVAAVAGGYGTAAGIPGYVPGAGGAGLPSYMGGLGVGDITGLGTSGSGAIKGIAPIMANLKAMAPQLATVAGLGIASHGVSQGTAWQGALGGGIAGWGAGTMVATQLFPKLAPWAGPIGLVAAAVGALIGWGMAAKKRGEQKKESAGIYKDYLDQAKLAVDQYNMHKTSYESAIGALTAMYERAVGSLEQYGKPGERTIELVTLYHGAAIDRINAVERVRLKRTEVMAGLPVPEFASGSNGIIRGLGGAFPAILHLGEAVLNAKAAAALGDQNIKALNQGKPAGGNTYNTINVYATDASGVANFFKKNMGHVVKGIRQAARDRGLPAPV